MDPDYSEFFNIKSKTIVCTPSDTADKPGYSFKCKLCNQEITILKDDIDDSTVLDKHVRTHYLRYKGEIE